MGLLVEFKNVNFSTDALINAVDRLISGGYDNGQGEYLPDESFESFENIQCYTLSTERVTTYQAFDTPFSGASYIDGAADLCTINRIYANGWVKVTYPVSSGTKTAYCRLSDFITPGAQVTHYLSSVSSNKTVYRRADMTESIGSVWTTDTFTVVARNGSALQIIYPLDAGGWKMGWIQST